MHTVTLDWHRGTLFVNTRKHAYGDDIGLRIEFPLHMKVPQRKAIQVIESSCQQLAWLQPSRGHWRVEIEALRNWLTTAGFANFLDELTWLSGCVSTMPEVEHDEETHLGVLQNRTYVRINVYHEDFMIDHRTRIFLSHKGANKPMVRGFFDVLRELGFAPWLDVEDMPAGTELHRGIRQGFDDSCAAVFFITPEFTDERYIRQEINYAIEEKTKKDTRFAIITLVFADNAGNFGSVPSLLDSYVRKQPNRELDALREIIRALPIALGSPTWRPGI